MAQPTPGPPGPRVVPIPETPFPAVSRLKAGLMAPTFMPWPLDLPVNLVFVVDTHRAPCKTMNQCFVEMVAMQRNQARFEDDNDIRFNFLIGGDGQVYEGRGWYCQPTITRKYKHMLLQPKSMLIAYFGNFMGERPQNMTKCLDDLIMYGVQNKFISPKFLQINLPKLGY